MTPRTFWSRLSRIARRGPCESGFTLIELLAVVGFTAVLMLFAVDFYIEITRASEAAMTRTRGGRRAVAVLDRIARDLEAAVLVKKPGDVDPLSHPWIFLAEDRGGVDGADHLKFVTRSRILRSTALHESDLELVSYVLREGDDRGLELLRWSFPRLPDELDRSFPAGEAEGAMLFADELASFGVRFLDEEGAWRSAWDSSTLVDSSELPLAAEISVAILPENDAPGEPAPEVYLRKVVIPVRPIDLQALLEAAEAAADCVTVRECVGLYPAVFAALEESDPNLAAAIDLDGDDCFSAHEELSNLPVPECQR